MSYLESLGFVYIITDGSAFKIGETSNCPSRRLAELQTGNPNKLTLVDVLHTPDRIAVEKHIHEHLAPWRCNGGSEWFKFPKEELGHALEAVESLYGASSLGDFKLTRYFGKTFTSQVKDYWTNGGTLTLLLDNYGEDDTSLNMTIYSENRHSKECGQAIMTQLARSLGIKTGSNVSISERLLNTLRLLPAKHTRKLSITYKRIKSRWLSLNDFEVISATKGGEWP